MLRIIVFINSLSVAWFFVKATKLFVKGAGESAEEIRTSRTASLSM